MCWTSVFPLHSFIFFLCFDSPAGHGPAVLKVILYAKKITLSWALCKLKARGSLEYFVRHPRKHLRVPWQKKQTANDDHWAQGVPQGAYSGPLSVAFGRIPKALKNLLQYSMCDNAITHYGYFIPASQSPPFPTVDKNYRGNIELQWPRRYDCLGCKMSLVARPEISTKKFPLENKCFWPHVSQGPRVAVLVQDLPTQALMILMLIGFLVLEYS